VLWEREKLYIMTNPERVFTECRAKIISKKDRGVLMQKGTENLVYHKASKCWEHVNRAIVILAKIVREEGPLNTPDYYKARNLLRDADGFLKEARENAKKLLGPVPPYASADYQKWRDELLEDFHILAMGREYEDLRSELVQDKFLSEWMDEESIVNYLKKHFQQQQSGKRKISNIKVRIILDRLEELIGQAHEMNKQAMQNQHS
jgi:hypothetical protein